MLVVIFDFVQKGESLNTPDGRTRNACWVSWKERTSSFTWKGEWLVTLTFRIIRVGSHGDVICAFGLDVVPNMYS